MYKDVARWLTHTRLRQISVDH